jgi:hypothetical protein
MFPFEGLGFFQPPPRRKRRFSILSWGCVVFRSILAAEIEALLVLFSLFVFKPFWALTLRSSLRGCLLRDFDFFPEDHPPIDFHSPSEFNRSSLPSLAENLAIFSLRTASSHEVWFPYSV